MDILRNIIAHKKKETEERKNLYPQRLLEQSVYFNGTPLSLKHYLLCPDKSGIIAEFKRKSPSKGVIHPTAQVERTTIGYLQAGASALSILTDHHFFGGSSRDLEVARAFNFCPILRKDFILEEYQILEAKAMGADAILLIAAALSPKTLKNLAAFARSLELEVLLEVHQPEELHTHLNPKVDIVGVNNRNLKTFTTNIQTSLTMATQIPGEFLKVSESGIHTPDTLLRLRAAGFNGFLIGEQFMKDTYPERAAKAFIEQLNITKTPKLV
jgi:indole-3-glycerol phosphate synthase